MVEVGPSASAGAMQDRSAATGWGTSVKVELEQSGHEGVTGTSVADGAHAVWP